LPTTFGDTSGDKQAPAEEAIMLSARVIRTLAAAALVLAGLASGCSDRLDRVHIGMMISDVEEIMRREPTEVIHGEGVETGKITWVYPQGRVIFEGVTVIQVEKSVVQPTVTERVEQQRGGR
jgi:hypothetical protein